MNPNDFRPRFAPTRVLAIALLALCAAPTPARAGGLLTPRGQGAANPIVIRDHRVRVTIDNGFAATEVTQVFFNSGPTDLEATYSFPVPESASLSEVTVVSGETLRCEGEVVAKEEARRIHEEEKSQGKRSALAEKNGFQTFEFAVNPVAAGAETTLRFLYYQPLSIEDNVGRYLYPLEDGGTDDAARAFWDTNAHVENVFSIDVELKSACPITQIRVPGRDATAKIDEPSPGRWRVHVERQADALASDFVLYYRIAEALPGRVDLVPYRADKDHPGTFMLVLTPGVDLAPLTGGADYVYVLDVSGSMEGKISTLGRGVSRALCEMSDQDRFRIVTFNDSARELTRGWVGATAEAREEWTERVDDLRANGSTNVYDGLRLAIDRLDADRATGIVLVTDGVTNTGIVEPGAFQTLLEKNDVRVFGFLMGNSANWPLMRIVADASGGFYAGVSNDDDIIGQLVQAKQKIRHECIHDAELHVSGVKVVDATDGFIGKVYRGQQLVMFGRYETAGPAEIRLVGRKTGQDFAYRIAVDFPEIATADPEVERLYAMAKVEEAQELAMLGRLNQEESRAIVRDLGLKYQLVTDETSMLVLPDEEFTARGIERKNLRRVAIEEGARTLRATREVVSAPRPQSQTMPTIPQQSPSNHGRSGGGALDPISAGLAAGVAALAALARRRKNAIIEKSA